MDLMRIFTQKGTLIHMANRFVIQWMLGDHRHNKRSLHLRQTNTDECLGIPFSSVADSASAIYNFLHFYKCPPRRYEVDIHFPLWNWKNEHKNFVIRLKSKAHFLFVTFELFSLIFPRIFQNDNTPSIFVI